MTQGKKMKTVRVGIVGAGAMGRTHVETPGTRVSVTWAVPSGATHTATLSLGSGPTP